MTAASRRLKSIQGECDEVAQQNENKFSFWNFTSKKLYLYNTRDHVRMITSL